MAWLLVSLIAAQPIDLGQAKALAEAGQKLFDQKLYRQAAQVFEDGFAQTQGPGFLFNAAQAWRKEGDCLRALSAYRRFLALKIDERQRATANARIVELDCLAAPSTGALSLETANTTAAPGTGALSLGTARTVAVPGTGTRDPETPDRGQTTASTLASSAPVDITPSAPPRRRPWWPLAVSGFGLAAGTTGAVLFGMSKAEYSRLTMSCSPLCHQPSYQGARLQETAGLSLLIAGAVTLAAGFIVWLVSVP